MSDLDLNLGRRVLEYRAINKLSQKEIAEKIGVSFPVISKVEKGESITAVSRCKIEMWLREQGGE